MSAIERGLYDISLGTLERLAKALELAPSALLAEAEHEGRRAIKGSPGDSRDTEG